MLISQKPINKNQQNKMETTIDFKGNIVLELLSIVKTHSNYTMAEILHSVIRPSNLKKLLLECTDEYLYTAIERAKESFEETDEVMSDEEFEKWKQK